MAHHASNNPERNTRRIQRRAAEQAMRRMNQEDTALARLIRGWSDSNMPVDIAACVDRKPTIPNRKMRPGDVW